MENQKVDMFLMSNAENFEPVNVPGIRAALLDAPDDKWVYLQSLGLKKPTTILIVSLLAGGFGIDRFMIGDTNLGIAKLLTCGGFGIWAIIDWFLIQSATRRKNLEKLQNLVQVGSTAELGPSLDE